jgi:hypothetical protein
MINTIGPNKINANKLGNAIRASTNSETKSSLSTVPIGMASTEGTPLVSFSLDAKQEFDTSETINAPMQNSCERAERQT